MLVGGGAGEIGTGIVHAFLITGATVIVPSRSEDRLDALSDHLGSAGVATDRLVTHVGNVGDPDGAEALREIVLGRFGRVDAVAASLGGMQLTERVTDTRVPVWNRVVESYVTANFILARTFLPVLADRDDGTYTVVNGSSGATGTISSPDGSLLSVASVGLHALVHALAADVDTFDESVQITELVPLVPVRSSSKRTMETGYLDAEAFGSVAVSLAAADDCHGATLGIRGRADVYEWRDDSGEWAPRQIPESCESRT